MSQQDPPNILELERRASEDDGAGFLTLSPEKAQAKCHTGEGARCCRYLFRGSSGLECGYRNEIARAWADAKVARFEFLARSGPCADPDDDLSEAKPYEGPA
jgi:hypothetical protein